MSKPDPTESCAHRISLRKNAGHYLALAIRGYAFVCLSCYRSNPGEYERGTIGLGRRRQVILDACVVCNDNRYTPVVLVLATEISGLGAPCKECGHPADPQATVHAADYDMAGQPDLHFCAPCRARAYQALQIVTAAINSGAATAQQVETAIVRLNVNQIKAESERN